MRLGNKDGPNDGQKNGQNNPPIAANSAPASDFVDNIMDKTTEDSKENA